LERTCEYYPHGGVDECWYLTSETPIHITCQDPDPQQTGEFAGGEVIKYRQRWKYDYRDSWGPWEEWQIVEGQEAFIYKTEDSIHELEWYCMDACGNGEELENHYFEIDIVDNQAPISVKEHGTPIIPDGGFDWVNQETEISLDCQDPEPHPVDQETLCYKVSLDDGELDYITERYCEYYDGEYMNEEDYCCLYVGDDEVENEFEFHFLEETYHNLEYYCVDHLGNDERDYNLIYEDPEYLTEDGAWIQWYKVDGTPPETTKTIDPEPYTKEIKGNLVEWIDTANEITLRASDEFGPHDSGVDKIWYMNVIDLSEDACWFEEVCQPVTGIPSPYAHGSECIDEAQDWCEIHWETEWNSWEACVEYHAHNMCDVDPLWKLYDGTPIQKEGESCHLLNYFAVDNLGNTEEMNVNCFFVDKEPPVTEKAYEGPSFPIPYSYYTEIEVDDSGEYLEVTVEDDGTWVTWNFDFPVETFTGDGNLNLGLIIATDGEGQGPAFQIHNNDGTDSSFGWGTWLMSPWGPTISDGWNGWHSGDTNTPVTSLSWVQATGNRNVPHGDGILQVKILKSELGESFHWAASPTVGSGFYAPMYDVSMQIPTAFGWSTPLVDMGVPNYIYAELTDSYPKWITTDTEVHLSAFDPEPHPSGVYETYWRNTIVDDVFCWDQELCQEAVVDGPWNEYEGPFTKERESCHLIEYYSIDNVGKEEVKKKQCVFVDDTPPVGDKEVGEPKYPCEEGVDKCGPQGEWPAWYVNSSTPIELSCVDQPPHPVDHEELCFAISFDEGQGTSYLTREYCNEFGGDLYLEQEQAYCCVPTGEEDTYEFHFLEESLHNIEWWCEDALGNEGEMSIEWDNVDNSPPEIIVHNPTPNEASNITRCTQSIVAEVWDEKSGVNESSIYAELFYDNDTAVPGYKVYLTKSVYGTYEGLMDKELPAGDYTLKVCASDNLGNEHCEEIDEILQETIFIEYIYPASCNVDPEQGGECDFTFNVCMRGDNGLKFWLDKLGGIVTPDMMNAMTIDPDDLDDAFVGLRHDGFISEAEFLQLGLDCTDINGREQFNLSLDISGEVAQAIGPGIHDLDYWIETFLKPNCV
jgi:hypothetical protein